jgi:hypothetical protein
MASRVLHALDRVGWLIALAFLAVGFIVVHGQGVSVDELRVSQLRACHRLNIVRAEDNRSQLVDYGLFTATADLIARAVAHPEHPATTRQKAAADAYLDRIRDDDLAKEWTELTKCGPATYHAATYIAPTPVPFAIRLPPMRALHVGPGE